MTRRRRAPLVLWCAPRTVSTAFERMMIERGDHTVFDEPFSAAYYLGPERRSDRFGLEEPDATNDAVVARLHDAADDGPVFVKDMAYQLGDALRADVLAGFTNTFLIRDPARALPSLARRWPDFTDDEAGYDALGRAVDLVAEVEDGTPVVLDSDDLLADPPTMVAAWCGAVGIAYRPDALRWEPGAPAEWVRWHDWYGRAAASTGFDPPSAVPPPPVDDPRLARAIEDSRPTYERLHRLRLRA